MRVKAGFVVYSPEKESRNIIILDEGELAAVDTSESPRKTIFKMHPGDLVGVSALLEREPFRYTIEATQDSNITIVSEECMESELKTIPVWLLAVIKSLSAKTHKLKAALYRPRTQNTLKSLTEYLSHVNAKTEIPLAPLVKEFHWLTKIPDATIQEDLKALARRKLVSIKESDGKPTIRFANPILLQIFVDYQNAMEIGEEWQPFSLTTQQKWILVKLATLNESEAKEAPAWISFLTEQKVKVDVAEWINMLHYGWFKPEKDNTFVPNTDKITYYIAALRYETNIKGVL